jgi:transposase-like protein
MALNETEEGWRRFIHVFKERGFSGVELYEFARDYFDTQI